MYRSCIRVQFLFAVAFLTLGCKGRPSNTTIGPTTLDGTIEKWQNKTPVWDNGPVPADQSPKHIHISKVFFDNDSQYFYAFLQCSPTIQQRYKVTQFSGDLGGIYFVPENNPDTGSPAERGGNNPNYRGYKTWVYLPIGVVATVGGTGGGTFVAYDLFRFTGKNLSENNGFNEKILPDTDQSSRHKGSLIAEGKDGVELAIPLEKLGLKPGATARIMIEPSILKPEVGFTTYTCH